jgi:hypothetical protein
VGGKGGQEGEMNQALYAHMNNKRKRKKKTLISIRGQIWWYVSIISDTPETIGGRLQSEASAAPSCPNSGRPYSKNN